MYEKLCNERLEVNANEEEEANGDKVEVDGEEEVGEASEDEQDAGDMRKMKRMIDPKRPSKEEVELHEFTHLPFRNWCPHCVKGRGLEASHKRVVRDRDAIPEVHVDFCFMGSEVGEGNLTIVVARDRDSRMTLSEVVPTKGSTGKFAATRVAAFIRELGYGSNSIIIKSDQEPAIVALVNDIIKFRAPAQTQPEQSPVGSSSSNGVVERGIQSFEMMLRVMKSALEKRWGVKVPDNHAVLTWMVGYASYLLNRFEVGRDGKTSYERLKGKKAKVCGFEFGEGLFFKIKEKNEGVGKMETRWRDGVYLGVRALSGELIVGTEGGICRTRTARRKPVEDRWCQENALRIGGVPWKVSEEDEGDGLPRSGVIEIDPKVLDERAEEVIRTTPVVPRKFGITRKDLVEHGFTEGCPGCKAALRGAGRQLHTDACRKRLSSEMKNEPKVKDAQKREIEFITEVIEGEQAKKKRKGEEDAEGNGEKVDAAACSSEVFVEGGKIVERGAKRKTEKSGDDVEYDDEGTRINSVGAHLLQKAGGTTTCDVALFEVNVEKLDEEMLQKAFDDVSGESLDPAKVSESRAEEIDFMQTRGIWEVVPTSLCWSKTGAGPTTVKWVDTKKRSRLVARDFKPKGEEERGDIFASMPPWEAKKLLFSRAASQKGLSKKRKLLFIDATKAHINGKCEMDAFIDLPEEIREAGKCAKLNFWLYGMRPAARAWEDTYAERFVEYGFVQGVSAPTVFFHKEKMLECVVHGDDFTVLGFDEDLGDLTTAMQGWFEVKVRGKIGPDSNDGKEITILNRTVVWMDWGIKIVADQKHAERLIEFFGLEEGSTSVVSIGKKDVDDKLSIDEEDEETAEKLSGKEESVYRGLAATLNYLSPDRFDIQFGSKELCRDMANPTSASMGKMKRAARYLLGFPTLEIEFVEQYPQRSMRVYVDSDWAGCLVTRKSTSGGVAMHGEHCIKTWASTQKTRATSSAEAEFYAIVEGASRGLGLKTLAADIGSNLEIVMYSDASAGRSLAFRKGLGKVRHIETKYLWIQDLVKDGRIKLLKVKGKDNPADIGTKHLSIADMESHLLKIGLKVVPRKRGG